MVTFPLLLIKGEKRNRLKGYTREMWPCAGVSIPGCCSGSEACSFLGCLPDSVTNRPGEGKDLGKERESREEGISCCQRWGFICRELPRVEALGRGQSRGEVLHLWRKKEHQAEERGLLQCVSRGRRARSARNCHHCTQGGRKQPALLNTYEYFLGAHDKKSK